MFTAEVKPLIEGYFPAAIVRVPTLTLLDLPLNRDAVPQTLWSDDYVTNLVRIARSELPQCDAAGQYFRLEGLQRTRFPATGLTIAVDVATVESVPVSMDDVRGDAMYALGVYRLLVRDDVFSQVASIIRKPYFFVGGPYEF